MSMYTSQWPVGFSSPPLSRKVVFDLTKSQLSSCICPVMKYLQEHSRTFLEVDFQCLFCTEMRLIKMWCKYFKAFLRILSCNSQLVSVRFLLLRHFEQIDAPTYAEVCREIVDFLGSQRGLMSVEFTLCMFGVHEGVQFLRKLIENNKESLTHLSLHEFICFKPMGKFHPPSHNLFDASPSTALQSLPSLADLPNLTSLKMDYWFFEKMMACLSTAIQTVKNGQTLVLSDIYLTYEHISTDIEDLRGLTSSDWQFLKVLCPNLEVAWFIYAKSQRDLEFFILPNMPITDLFFACAAEETEIKSGALIGHLLSCNTNNYLVYLHIIFSSPTLDLAFAFPPFLQICRKLESFRLTVKYPAIGVDVLMQSWLENRPESLQEVVITISHSEGHQDDFANLMSLEGELRLRGLDVYVDHSLRRQQM